LHCGGASPELSNKKTPLVNRVCYDSRKITEVKNTAFFALRGSFRDGHHFIDAAYDLGVRIFVVDQKIDPTFYPDAFILEVNNTLGALQQLAKKHREKFDYPVVAITGSSGKTTVKEWIYHLIKQDKRVIRSPKSYNSQLGVALSLLELNETYDIALIEAGISEPNEMHVLTEMIQPNLGVLTTLGRAHRENFASISELHQEKMSLFKGETETIVGVGTKLPTETLTQIHGTVVAPDAYNDILSEFPYNDIASLNNIKLAIQVALKLGVNVKKISQQIPTTPQLALRLETFEGINQSIIINDTYNLDIDALEYSLEYQKLIAKKKKRIVLVGLDTENENRRKEVTAIIERFKPDEVLLIDNIADVSYAYENAVILIKGTRNSNMEKVAQKFRLKRHKTFVEIDLSAIRHNLGLVRKKLKQKTKILAMVKAQSYGSGLEKMASFLEQQGVDYLGVAYVDEGVELRKNGIKIPILVMNPEEESFDLCIQYQLEPAIYSFNQLDVFIKELIFNKQSNFPVHIKFDTGMRRLGFEPENLSELINVIKSQPEIRVAGVYSHLADADNVRDRRFTLLQAATFNNICKKLADELGTSFIRHLANSEAIFNFPELQMDMVRIGIGMYGISGNINIQKIMRSALRWESSISQIKSVKVGESVGYSRTFKATKATIIAIIPVGYADGFKRSLGNGKGGVYINNLFCPTVGRVCMDMIMVDIQRLKVEEGACVEIIGKNQSIEALAEKMQTIPYELMTSISKRVHRVYIE
jgi:alanine racemase